MDPSRFDGLARGIAGFTSRRTTLAGLLAGLAVPLLGEGESEARKHRNKRRRDHGRDRDREANEKQGHAGHGVDAEKKKKKKCKPPTTTCGKKCFTLQTDRANCGACGKACPAGIACVNGACAIPANCGAGGACTGGETCCADICVDTATDPENCGQCSDTCRDGETCSGGNCVCGNDTCADNETCCSGACVNTDNDLVNCGACGNDCGFGQACSEGVCVCGASPACTNQEFCCSAGCANIATDVNNCGQCEHVCGANEQCCGGDCVNITTVQNCGSCGHVCPGYGLTSADATCFNETCSLTCKGDNYDVDGDPSNGCEQTYTGGGHTKDENVAISLGNMSSCASSAVTPASTIYSDARIHTNPQVLAFNVATGAAPQWWVVNATGDGFCGNDLDVTLNMTGATGNCYKLTVLANDGVKTWTAQTSGGVAHIHEDAGAYASGTQVFFKVEKTCSSSVREAASYTITYHL